MEEEFLESNQVMTKNIFKGRKELTIDDYLDVRSSI